MKYQTQNGWTKESMKEYITKEFKGKSLAANSQKRCVYRGPEGRKCAVGMFISEDDYVPVMDRNIGGSDDLFTHFPQLLKSMPLNAEGMGNLQIIHDNSDTITSLDEMLQWVENYVK